MTQKVNLQANVMSVTLSPLIRWLRGFIQLVISVGVAIPIILNTPEVAGNAVIAKDLGIVAGLVATITAIWNGLENAGIIPVVGGEPATVLNPTITAKEAPHPVPDGVPSL